MDALRPYRERVAHLSSPFDLIGVQIDGRGGHRSMAQVVPYRRKLRTACQSMSGMGMAHPMWAGPAKLICRSGGSFLDRGRRGREEAFHQAPDPGGSDAEFAV